MLRTFSLYCLNCFLITVSFFTDEINISANSLEKLTTHYSYNGCGAGKDYLMFIFLAVCTVRFVHFLF